MNKNAIAMATLLLLLTGTTALASEFCDGYQAGYKTGYQKKHKTTVKPVSPVCPVKPLKRFGDPQSDYEFGYTIGYDDAKKKS